MRAVLIPSLAFAALSAASALAPASADQTMAALRDTESLSTGRFPAMDRVDCVEPYCIHKTDGSLDHERSTEALERALNSGKR